MSRKYRVISGDGHVETAPDAWVKHVPSKWRDRAPRLIRMPEGGEAWQVEGMPLLYNESSGKRLQQAGEGHRLLVRTRRQALAGEEWVCVVK